MLPLCDERLQEVIEPRLPLPLINSCRPVAETLDVSSCLHARELVYTYIIMKSTEEYRVRVCPSVAVARAISLIFCSIAPKIVLKD